MYVLKILKIVVLEENKTIRFAANELKKYLDIITDHEIIIKNSICSSKNLIIGTFQTLSTEKEKKARTSDFDDAVYISTKGTSGFIAGSNPRSVLLSVYRYLRELGFRWIRPGKDGELLPEFDIEEKNIDIYEVPSYKFRGICIEGAVSYEDIYDMVDWIPKIGLNSYFIQFREAYTFFQRWYDHVGNPFFEPGEKMPLIKARGYVKNISEEISKRDLIYQAVGHGWTCEPFGIPGISWDKWEGEITKDTSDFFALVNNKRELWHGVPLNTNACYSNSEARMRIIEDICTYAHSHPEVDIIHFWLSDGNNNHCECANCKDTNPSDEYVSMLNYLDTELTKRNIETKIVFLIYQDLLWPPEKQSIMNKDRFILLFAPITRTYRSSFTAKNTIPEIPEYIRNNIKLPNTVEENIAFLKKWQKGFKGEGIDFDYHFMWAHHKDPGYFAISRILHEDILSLHDIGLNGYVSCQVQRSTFPNGLGIYVMGRALWSKNLTFDKIAEDYFLSAYGENWKSCYDYLEKLSELYFELDLEEKIICASKKKAVLCDEIIKHLENYQFENEIGSDNCWMLSWQILKEHSIIWIEITKALREIYLGNKSQAQKHWAGIKTRLWEIEPEYAKYLDVFNFIRTFEGVM